MGHVGAIWGLVGVCLLLGSAVVRLATRDQLVPSQWRITPRWPTAQTSFGPLPQRSYRRLVVPLVIGDQVPIPVTSFNTSNTIGGSVVALIAGLS